MSDPMSKAATKAATMATKLDFKLLAAASASLSREQRSDYLRLAFSQWAKLCRAMSDLEAVAPNAAREGFEEDRKARDFIEARAK